MVHKSDEIKMGYLPVLPVLQKIGGSGLKQRGAGFSLGRVMYQCQECFIVLEFEKMLDHAVETNHKFRRVE